MKDIRDVAVIGAGIAGSSLAKNLADKGWETVLIDRHRFPRHKVCGEFLSPESLGMLSEMGLRNTVASLLPHTIQATRLILRDGTVLNIPLPGTALGISRYVLDAALHQAAFQSGVEVHTGTTVTAVHPGAGGGYRIETQRGEDTQSIQVRTVIAAWGGNPRLAFASHTHGRDQRVNSAYVGVKSHYAGIEMEPVVELYFFEGGYIGISPIEGGLVNVCALLKREAFRDSDAVKSVLGLLAAAVLRNPALQRKLSLGVPVPGTQAAVAPVHLHRKPMPWGEFAHIGDASLMVPPLCGDGMSMALRSAGLCAQCADGYLSGSLSLAKWRQEYSQSVSEEFSRPLRWGRLLHSISAMPVLPRLLVELAQLLPNLATGLVQATRLKDPGK